MPKEITHILIAQKIRNALSPGLRKILDEHSGIYLFGSTAPDLFYYDVPTPFDRSPSTEGFGELLHGRYGNNNTEHIFRMLKDARKHEQTGRLFAFIAGYLTHVAADTVFHPLIYSATGDYFDENKMERLLSQCRHRILETGLDLHMLKKNERTLSDFRPAVLTEIPTNFRNELLDFYFTSVREVYDSSFEPGKAALRALRKSRMVSKIMLSPIAFFILHNLNKVLSRKLDFFVNLIYTDRAVTKTERIFSDASRVPHPVTGATARFDLDKLVNAATVRGKLYTQVAHRYLMGKATERELRRVIAPLSLNNGMARTPNSKMKHYRILSGLETYVK